MKFILVAIFVILPVIHTPTLNAAPIEFENIFGIGKYWTDWYGSIVENGDLEILTDNYILPKDTPWYQDTVLCGSAFPEAYRRLHKI